jgi:hypothetical protein
MFEVQFTLSTRVLVGLEAIGRYLHVHHRTAWRWVHEHGLPAMQTPAGTWQTSTSLIDLWIIAASKAQRQARTGKALGASLDYGGIDTFLG